MPSSRSLTFCRTQVLLKQNSVCESFICYFLLYVFYFPVLKLNFKRENGPFYHTNELHCVPSILASGANHVTGRGERRYVFFDFVACLLNRTRRVVFTCDLESFGSTALCPDSLPLSYHFRGHIGSGSTRWRTLTCAESFFHCSGASSITSSDSAPAQKCTLRLDVP